MFGKKVKGVSVPRLVVPREEINIQELDKLYREKSVSELGNLDRYNLSDNDHRALNVLQKCSSLDLSPIAINPNWYIYSFLGSWFSDSVLRPSEIIQYAYRFPLPYKASKILETVVKAIGRRGNVAKIYIGSLNPTLGVLPSETDQRQSVLSDPILLLIVSFRGKDYAYELASWDLSLDFEGTNLDEQV